LGYGPEVDNKVVGDIWLRKHSFVYNRIGSLLEMTLTVKIFIESVKRPLIRIVWQSFNMQLD
jgi:hypothetical protein